MKCFKSLLLTSTFFLSLLAMESEKTQSRLSAHALTPAAQALIEKLAQATTRRDYLFVASDVYDNKNLFEQEISILLVSRDHLSTALSIDDFALILAAFNNHASMIPLLHKEAPFEFRKSVGSLALRLAARKGNVDAIVQLLELSFKNQNAIISMQKLYPNDSTADSIYLYAAIRGGHLAATRLLIDSNPCAFLAELENLKRNALQAEDTTMKELLDLKASEHKKESGKKEKESKHK